MSRSGLAAALTALLFLSTSPLACDDGGGGGSEDAGTDVVDTSSDTTPDVDDDAVAIGTLQGSVSTSDGQSASGATVSADGATTTVAADGTYTLEVDAGTYTVVASLPGYMDASQSVTVDADETVTVDLVLEAASNVPPTVDDIQIEPSPIARGGMASAAATVTDPDDALDTLTFEWTATGGFTVAPTTPGLATVTAPNMPNAAGTVSVTVTDAAGGSDSLTVDVSTGANSAPVIESIVPSEMQPVSPGAMFDVTATASDPEGDALMYAWSVDDEAWSVDFTASAAAVTAANAFTATTTLTVTVTDSQGGMASDSILLETLDCADPRLLDCDGDASNGCEQPDSGLSELCAAPSCVTVGARSPGIGDGTYWLEDGNGQAYEAYCDMTTDGGGWTLLGTVSGADADQWNTRFGFWSDTNLVGSASDPWLDYKSPAWIDKDLTDAAVLVQRRYDGNVVARTVLENACLQSQTTFGSVFAIYDTSVACSPTDMHVLESDAVGLASAEFQEGVGAKGLGSTSTNGLCWATIDTAVNTFSGHFGWNENPGATDCAQGSHAGGIAVFESDGMQFTNADITGTSWLVGTDFTKTDISFFAREPLTLIGAADVSDPGRWSNGTYARSCNGYRNPSPAWRAVWDDAYSDGIYTIDVDGNGPLPPTDVFCDMTTDGGGWTALVANGDNTDEETPDASNCYPHITNDTAAGCGDPTDLFGDFTLSGDVQGGISWQRLLAISYGDLGYSDKLGYFGIDFGSPAPTTDERNGGTPYNPGNLTTQEGVIACTNTGGIRIVHYTTAGTYVSNASFIANGKGTVFGHDTVGSMASSARRSFGFTDTRDHSGDGSRSSVYGLDDYQDGWSCGDLWMPQALRGARLMVLVR